MRDANTKRTNVVVRLRRTTGVILMAFSYLALPIVLITTARIAFAWGATIRILVAIAGLVAAVAYVPWYRRAIRLGRRLVAVSAEEVLCNPDGRFVLYLRSFRDEDISGHKSHGSVWARLLAHDERLGARPEERLIIVAHGAGPMIALGRPGDRLPPIGAARLYIAQTDKDDEWKTVVQDLSQRASMVIVQVGEVSPGLLWEIHNISRFVEPERLIIYMPQRGGASSPVDASDRTTFVEKYGQYFPKDLPRELGDARCVIFDAEWTPTGIGPWSLPIRSAVGVLNEAHDLLTAPADLGLDEDTISILSAVERNYPEYQLPVESELPFDLQVHRAFDVMFGFFGKLGATASLLVILWPESVQRAAFWLSQWF